jgi:diguanylate cyclase (GGDEF)-like protein
MLNLAANSTIALDISTLFIVATSVTGLLGLFLFFAWMQDRVRALAWWGSAYLVGGLSVAVWSIEHLISPPLPAGAANALLFISCGMIWNAARLFHGRPVLWGALAAGATAWLIACQFADFVASLSARMVLSSLIVSLYTFLTAAELWRERRKHLLRRWPAIFVPMLHGAVFLIPIPLAGVLPSDGGMVNLASGWIAVFMLETTLYAVGSAFIGLFLANERAVRIHRDAASTDPLTGLLNRRGFSEAATALIARQTRNLEPVSVLMFDLDQFKRINDRFGHAVGDETLRVFAATTNASMRSTDIIGRIGGEEFAAVLPGTLADAVAAAERVRSVFQTAGVMIADCNLVATVSVGAASGAPGASLDNLLASADSALYLAKANGRNRVEGIDEALWGMPVAARASKPTDFVALARALAQPAA